MKSISKKLRNGAKKPPRKQTKISLKEHFFNGILALAFGICFGIICAIYPYPFERELMLGAGILVGFCSLLVLIYTKRPFRPVNVNIFKTSETVEAVRPFGYIYFRWECPVCGVHNTIREYSAQTYLKACIACGTVQDVVIFKKNEKD